MGFVKITPAGEKITCRAGGNAKFQFSLSNASGSDLRCGVDIRVDGDAGTWMTVEGSIERELTEGVDTTVNVVVAPPKTLLDENATDKTYTFRLRIYDSKNPETAVDSSTVSVVVQAAAQAQKRSPWTWLIPLIIVALIALGTTIYMLWPDGVPNFVGQIYSTELEDQLQDKNYLISLQEELSEQEPGAILSQVPAAGEAKTAPDENGYSAIAFTISATTIDVPDVVGKTVADAELLINAEGLEVGDIVEVKTTSRSLSSAEVLGQSPGGNERVLPGTKINLSISPQSVLVPSVVGFNFNEAKSELESLGLRVSMETRITGQAAQGLIISHAPSAGKQVKVGSVVKVIVEKAVVNVPNVVGQTPENARRILGRLGLKIKTVLEGTAVLDSRVQKQQPKANSKVDLGATVTIVYPRSVFVGKTMRVESKALLERPTLQLPTK